MCEKNVFVFFAPNFVYRTQIYNWLKWKKMKILNELEVERRELSQRNAIHKEFIQFTI